MRADRIASVGDVVGESPRWDARTGELVWVDAERPVIHSFNPTTNRLANCRTQQVVTSIALSSDGGYIGTAHDGIRQIRRADHGHLEVGALLTPIEPPVGCSVNDSAVDPAGRILVGFGSETQAGLGEVLVVECSSKRPVVLKAGMFLPNGMAWNPLGDRIYIADSYERVVYSIGYDRKTGSMLDVKHLIRSSGGELPDGLTVDLKGNLWVAFWGGGRVTQYDVEGRELATIEIPTAQVSSCTFGGADFNDLYVTTAAYETQAGGAGDLYVARGVGIGVPSNLCTIIGPQGDRE
jgi:sugar lactone lactonase YvrE